MSHANVIMALDSSSSMRRFGDAPRVALNNMIAAVKKAALETQHGMSVGMIEFSDFAHTSLPLMAAANVPTMRSFNPYGNTALWDAILLAKDMVGQKYLGRPTRQMDENNHTLILVTDGEDTNSVRWSAARFAQWVRDLEVGPNNWTFVFAVPPGKKAALVRLGVSEWNVKEWEQTEAGVKEMEEKTSAGFATYIRETARGARSVKNWYATDLTGVTSADLRSQASNLSGRFHLAPVVGTNQLTGKPWAIKDWYERYSGQAYVIGSVYYQLVKPEDVQPVKEVAIRDPLTGEVFGGRDARRILGIPDGAGTVKVKPGHHGNFQVFVQSTSVNRLLPDGTFCLIDSMLKTSLPPTWDHTQVTTGRRV